MTRDFTPGNVVYVEQRATPAASEPHKSELYWVHDPFLKKDWLVHADGDLIEELPVIEDDYRLLACIFRDYGVSVDRFISTTDAPEGVLRLLFSIESRIYSMRKADTWTSKPN